MATTNLKITGMSCGHCVQTVQQALESVDGVERAKVDLGKASAFVEYDASRTTPAAMTRAVTDEGYVAVEM